MAESASVWLDTLVAHAPGCSREQREQLAGEVATLSPQMQVNVLRECVRRMPSLQSDDYRSAEYAIGSVLYDITCRLYTRKLPYTEDDICALLESSKHVCGHGTDVTPPLDIAHKHMRKHGFSTHIADAVRRYLFHLRGVGSAKANFAKRRAAIMLVADSRDVAGAESGWTSHFRSLLAAFPEDDRRAWQRFVLAMKANDVYRQPASWQKTSAQLLAALPQSVVVDRVAAWLTFADDAHLRVMKTGGSHVLKHLVWMLATIANNDELRSSCDQLVIRIAQIDWTPKDRSSKFMKAAAYYLSDRAPDVAWSALDTLAKWAGDSDEKLREIVQRYGVDHGLTGKPQTESPVRRWVARVFSRA